MQNQRADATRNRERLLAVAAELTAEHGSPPSLAELATSAGLGVGTVYRHFATRNELADALVAGKLDLLLERGREAVASDTDDALEPFLREAIVMLAGDATLAEVFTRADSRADLLEVFQALVSRAQSAGLVRADLGVGDIHHLVCGLQVALRLSGDASVETYTDVLLVGLKPASRRTIEP